MPFIYTFRCFEKQIGETKDEERLSEGRYTNKSRERVATDTRGERRMEKALL
jgi:hypothetical protein